MNEIKTFAFQNEHDVRVVDYNGLPHFVLSDVCKVLDLKNSRTAKEGLDDDECIVFNYNYISKSGKKMQNKLTLVTESGLYALIFRSRKTFAREFRKWVTSEVLPSLRREKYELLKHDSQQEKPLIETIVSMIRSINERIIAREDIPASILKYAWNMANISKEMSVKNSRKRDLFIAPLQDFSVVAEEFISAVSDSLEYETTYCPDTIPLNVNSASVFFCTEAMKAICEKIDLKEKVIETVLEMARAGFIPQIQEKIRRYPHHSGCGAARKSGIMWNYVPGQRVRIIDFIDGHLQEVSIY
ncbi:MAG: hypothetical protein E7054_07045 [Lentisphaerae bacterium]|nr:hypothetical protein [Lentisphaerota bacterium]